MGRAIDLTSKLATSWVGLLTAYAGAATAAVVAFKKLEDPLRDWPLWGRIVLVGLLPLAAFAFHTVPAFMEQRRKRKLCEITGNLRPGYFRLAPRQDEDQESFTRADGMHDEVLAWLRRPPASLLYLTGQSGSGKSSLLAAWALPHLISEGTHVIRLRGYQDPLAALEHELLEPGVIWQKLSPNTGDPRCLLEQACHQLSGRLLVVLDQFEEFVILQDPERRKQFEDFLASLRQSPIANLVFLFVFRSDYIGLVEKLSLPPLVQSSNWKEVPPFTEMAALGFMKGSGLEVDDNLLRSVLREAGELEQTKGLVRPITINLCGLVLGRFASGLPRAFRQGGLIRAFLRESVFLPSIRDVAPHVLPHLISGYVTKRPRAVADLAKDTKLDPAAVRGCLRVLGQNDRAIVRAIDAEQQTWEISHDFLVPMLDSIVARWTVSLWGKTRPWLPWFGAAAMVAGVVASSYWRPDPIRQLTELGWVVWRAQDGFYVSINALPPKESVDALRRIPKPFILGLTGYAEFDRRVSEWDGLPNLRCIDLSRTDIKRPDLEPLRGLSHLSCLNLWDAGIEDADLEQLKSLARLSMLNLGENRVHNLEPLGGLTMLSTLNLEHTDVTSLEPLRRLKELSTLRLGGTRIADLAPLAGLNKLSDLELGEIICCPRHEDIQGELRGVALGLVPMGRSQLSNLEPLRGLTALSTLKLPRTEVSNVEPLKNLTNLSTLDLDSTRVTDLEPLRGLTNLRTLDLSSTAVKDLEPLRGLTALSTLRLPRTEVSNLEPLKNLTNLSTLDLYSTRVTDLEPLRGLTNLTDLDLANTEVSNLEALKGLKRLESLSISGPNVSEDAIADLLAANKNLMINGSRDLKTPKAP